MAIVLFNHTISKESAQVQIPIACGLFCLGTVRLSVCTQRHWTKGHTMIVIQEREDSHPLKEQG